MLKFGKTFVEIWEDTACLGPHIFENEHVFPCVIGQNDAPQFYIRLLCFGQMRQYRRQKCSRCQRETYVGLDALTSGIHY